MSINPADNLWILYVGDVIRLADRVPNDIDYIEEIIDRSTPISEYTVSFKTEAENLYKVLKRHIDDLEANIEYF